MSKPTGFKKPDPTPQEIEERAAEIRAGWSEPAQPQPLELGRDVIAMPVQFLADFRLP